MTGLLAGISPKSVLLVEGQQVNKERDGNPLNQDTPADFLGLYNQATFVAYVGSMFVVNVGAQGSVSVRLTEVNAMRSPLNGECFSLVFQSFDDLKLPQATYEIEHGALGSFLLFLVPGDNSDPGQRYVAIINRLP